MMWSFLSRFRIFLLAFALSAAPASAAEAPPVRASEDASTITLENGQLTLVISRKKASIFSVTYREGGQEVELG
ncbi:MAG: hypothetical protein JO112_09440, partial [Planctomycetes bacterium]|nr:hypothetical protein [Planctomycetota bacterium]